MKNPWNCFKVREKSKYLEEFFINRTCIETKTQRAYIKSNKYGMLLLNLTINIQSISS